MIRKISIIITASLILHGCASQKESMRIPSNDPKPEAKMRVMANNISCQKGAFVKFSHKDGSMLSSLENDQIIIDLKSCAGDHPDAFNKRFMHVKVHESGIWLHSLDGHVYILNESTFKELITPFPVASFELRRGELTLYNANNAGRFCSFKQLKLEEQNRDKSCQLAEITLVIQELE